MSTDPLGREPFSRRLPGPRRAVIDARRNETLLIVGDDWAEEHHDVEIQDEAGRKLAARRLPEGRRSRPHCSTRTSATASR